MSVLSGARVLITGGSGFLGNALVRHILRDESPEAVIVFSRGEFKHAQMRDRFQDRRLRTYIGDVRDIERLRLALRNVDVVIHAAALKRVDACESDPYEAVKTNVVGTANVIQVCVEQGVKRALFISSDKACAPLNLYGASKRCAESLWLAAHAYATTAGPLFSAVRYGNVSGSTGSVIPLWREHIAAGRKIPLTDPDATRFWFTADQAVGLVLDTLEAMRGGELVVPELPSFLLSDLAVAFSWPVEVVGQRAGDKAAESMIAEDEAPYFRKSAGRYVRYCFGDQEGDPLPRGFSYRSDTNPMRMSVNDLRDALEQV